VIDRCDAFVCAESALVSMRMIVVTSRAQKVMRTRVKRRLVRLITVMKRMRFSEVRLLHFTLVSCYLLFLNNLSKYACNVIAHHRLGRRVGRDDRAHHRCKGLPVP
jgi:hypothetical protein